MPSKLHDNPVRVGQDGLQGSLEVWMFDHLIWRKHSITKSWQWQQLTTLLGLMCLSLNTGVQPTGLAKSTLALALGSPPPHDSMILSMAWQTDSSKSTRHFSFETNWFNPRHCVDNILMRLCEMQLPQVLNCVSRHHSGTPSTSTFVGHWYLAPSKYTKPLSRESLDRSSDNSSIKQGPFNQSSKHLSRAKEQWRCVPP